MTASAVHPAQVLDRDGELARVSEVLNAHRMAPRLRAALSTRGAACSVLDAKYEPGVRCRVLYGLGDRLARGDLVGEDEPNEPEALVVPPGVRLHVYPRDPDLPGLGTAADPAALTRVLREVLPDSGRRVLGCRVRLLRYRPGKRATLGVDLRAATPSPSGARCVVKVYDDARKAAAVAAEAESLALSVDADAPLRFAPVLAHVPEHSLVVQGWAGGVRLDVTLAAAGPSAAGPLHRAALALAALHRIPPVGERRRPVDVELARFRERSARVTSVDAAAGEALGALAARLEASAADVGPGGSGLVHGDCKPSQFLLHGERVVLLDLDSAGLADPAADVGTFLATVRQHAARRLLARRTTAAGASAMARLAEVFLETYLAEGPPAGRNELRRRIRWYEAVAFERKAIRCYARAPHSPLTAALVDLGHTCLDRIGGGI